MQNRRTFLSSAAAAGVGAAVGGAVALPAAASNLQGHAHWDPFLTELGRQFRDTLAAVGGGRGRPGEHARRVAGYIRLLNAHGVVNAVDAELRRALRREGREAFLARELDRAAFAAELKSLGVDRVPPLSATYADRARVFDFTLRNGMQGTLAAVADSFDRLGAPLDRHVVTNVARQDADCFEWLVGLTSIEAVSWQWCVISAEQCSLMIGLLIVYLHFMCMLGCACFI